VDGSPSKGALAAIHDAYAANKQFPGFMNQVSGDAKAPFAVEKILDKALQGKRAEQADIEGESVDRAKSLLGLDGKPLKILPPSSPKEP
jgi:exopolyphosphatase/pppGpp-phosphohydrolase